MWLHGFALRVARGTATTSWEQRISFEAQVRPLWQPDMTETNRPTPTGSVDTRSNPEVANRIMAETPENIQAPALGFATAQRVVQRQSPPHHSESQAGSSCSSKGFSPAPVASYCQVRTKPSDNKASVTPSMQGKDLALMLDQQVVVSEPIPTPTSNPAASSTTPFEKSYEPSSSHAGRRSEQLDQLFAARALDHQFCGSEQAPQVLVHQPRARTRVTHSECHGSTWPAARRSNFCPPPAGLVEA